MASRRMRGRGDKAQDILSTAVTYYGSSPWTFSDLRQKKNVGIHHGIVSFMHGEGLICKKERRGCVSSWAVTAKGMSMVRRG
jgi:hypothetical protein